MGTNLNEDDFSFISPVFSGVRITQSFAVCGGVVFTLDIPVFSGVLVAHFFDFSVVLCCVYP